MVPSFLHSCIVVVRYRILHVETNEIFCLHITHHVITVTWDQSVTWTTTTSYSIEREIILIISNLDKGDCRSYTMEGECPWVICSGGDMSRGYVQGGMLYTGHFPSGHFPLGVGHSPLQNDYPDNYPPRIQRVSR